MRRTGTAAEERLTAAFDRRGKIANNSDLLDGARKGRAFHDSNSNLLKEDEKGMRVWKSMK